MKKLMIFFLLFFSIYGNAGNGPTLEEKIGQMIMIGFRGYELNEESPVIEDIRTGAVGGVILYLYDGMTKETHRNIYSSEQLKKLTEFLQIHPKTPLLIAVDQEGGIIDHLPYFRGFGVTQSVSAQFLGEQNNDALTHYYAAECAKLFKEMGLNLNLAPVVDLNVNPQNPVIALRQKSFSKDSEIVVKHAEIFIDEHHQRGIFTTLKHFPGHGSSTEDSHHGLADITTTWSANELKPFLELVKKRKVDVIMTGHVFNSKLDPQYPATMSKSIIQGILRKKIGYNGVVISDDLQMKAIDGQYSMETVIEKTINAEIDILLFANQQTYDEDIATKVIDTVKKLIKERKVSEKRIDESYKRIQMLKARLL